MNYDEIIEFLVQEVRKKIEEEKEQKYNIEKNRALVIIHGGNADFSQVLVELENLSKQYNLEVAYTRNGKKLSYSKISEIIKTERELSYENSEEILKGKSLILLPFLTKSSAAKIAYGIRDTEESYLISKAILSGKVIVATYNSCRIDGRSEYIDQINSNIDKLKKYGIRFTEAKNLARYVEEILSKKIIYLTDKKSISTRDIANLSDVNIIVSKDTSITTLVYDRARELKINIIRE